MPTCTSCGRQFDESVRFCPSCGSPAQQTQADAGQGGYQQSYQPPVYQQPPVQQGAASNTDDKTMAILAVIFPVLFFLPLVAGTKSEFGKFWANQSLLLLIAGAALSILASVWWIIAILAGLLSLGLAVLWIIGIITVVKGEMKPLPLIGGIKIL